MHAHTQSCSKQHSLTHSLTISQKQASEQCGDGSGFQDSVFDVRCSFVRCLFVRSVFDVRSFVLVFVRWLLLGCWVAGLRVVICKFDLPWLCLSVDESTFFQVDAVFATEGTNIVWFR